MRGCLWHLRDLEIEVIRREESEEENHKVFRGSFEEEFQPLLIR